MAPGAAVRIATLVCSGAEMMARYTALQRALAGALLCACAACASTPTVDPAYRPVENALEVIAVLRAHIDDDTYRFEPARDFTGRNVYRSSLLRLENLEQLHPDAYRAGHLDGAIAFAKARSLERLRAFDLAAENYRLAASISDELRVEALRSAEICDTLQEAAQMARALTPASEAPGSEALDTDAALAEFEARVALLDGLARIAEDTHQLPIALEEIERADMERAAYFAGRRTVDAGGDVRAIAELQRVIQRHAASKRINRHLLALADLYAELAAEYSSAYPPESLLFDPVRFQELVDGASRLYETVASRDGTPEKVEASRRLEAFLAFSIRIDRDRFTP